VVGNPSGNCDLARPQPANRNFTVFPQSFYPFSVQWFQYNKKRNHDTELNQWHSPALFLNSGGGDEVL
jgi:hypothetical protein